LPLRDDARSSTSEPVADHVEKVVERRRELLLPGQEKKRIRVPEPVADVVISNDRDSANPTCNAGRIFRTARIA